MTRFRRFCALGWEERRLFCESLLFHLIVGLVLKVVPFRWIPRLFASRQSAVGSPQSTVVEKIRVAVQRAGWISPWKNRCLVSSLAGRWMLNRRRIASTLSLGVTKNPDEKTIAHAWLIASGCEIVEKRGEYTELYRF